MNTKRATIGAASALILALALGSAEARNISFNGRFSGTSVNTQSDTDGDGLIDKRASLSIAGIKSNLGSATAQPCGGMGSGLELSVG